MSDVRLEVESVVLDAATTVVAGHDLCIDSQARRSTDGPALRRALVHDFKDGLTINWDGDYPGGVTIRGDVEIPGFIRIENGTARRLHAEKIELQLRSPLPRITGAGAHAAPAEGVAAHGHNMATLNTPHHALHLPSDLLQPGTADLEQQLRAAFQVIAELRDRVERLEQHHGYPRERPP